MREQLIPLVLDNQLSVLLFHWRIRNLDLRDVEGVAGGHRFK